MSLPTDPIAVCAAADLVDGGLAVKLPATESGRAATVFFVRYKGRAYGYLNRCTHVASEMDWEGRLFTRDGQLLMCARHGATFHPDTGLCLGGAPKGSRLHALQVQERDGQVYWIPGPRVFPA
ncbi:Rieske 2Fe-2S domain-containing protein [Orrella sp. JC864]|uniref:Rieske 2Fe-2S domain-containing protein n=1 Tax=Orrella sp. JC864 TaxID=3120298 RepID=UPI0012BB7A53